MNAADVVGYVCDGAFYCLDCFDSDTDGDEVGAVFVDSEHDYYPVCDACGERCEDVKLTTEGYEREHPEENETEEN